MDQRPTIRPETTNYIEVNLGTKLTDLRLKQESILMDEEESRRGHCLR